MFSEIFFTFLVTSVIGLTIGSLKMCYKSKCTSIKFCGLEIKRDTVGEEKLDENQNQNQIANQETKENIV
jgi:hypothetical protein